MALGRKVNDFESAIVGLSDSQLKDKPSEFRKRLEAGESIDDLLPEAFSVVREVSKRSLNMRHFDVQVLGGIALHEGKIAEMKNGGGQDPCCHPTRLSECTRRQRGPYCYG